MDSSLTADEKITTLCEKHLNIPPWRDPSGLINAYNPSLRPMTAKAIYKNKGRIYIDCEVVGEELKDLKYIKLPSISY